jgi:PhnB protein
MPELSLMDRLDQALDAMFARGSAPLTVEPGIVALLEIAENLRDLPRQNFKARLKSDLERKTSMASTTETLAVRQTAIPQFRIRNVAAAIEFYKSAFGAREVMRFNVHGVVAHAELSIGNSALMLGEESPEYGFLSAETYGGSPMNIRLNVDDVDAFIAHAVEAGAKLASPPADQFYGDRSGSVTDPFGYTWFVSTTKEHLSMDEMYRRFEAMTSQPEPDKPAVNPIREGFRTLTPYLVATDAAGLVDFLKQTFEATENFRSVGSAGGMHCEMRLGDSMMMVGGGAPGLEWQGESQPMAFHVYVPDIDATYRRAIDAGAVSMQEPADQEWGERTGHVKDPAGNNWYIATARGENYFSEGAPSVQPYLHPLRGEPVINFLKRAFGAVELGRYTNPEGVILHTTLKIGNSQMELGDADGPYRPMPSMFYVFVPDVDASYRRALAAGATSMNEPADQPYGDRGAAVKDPFGNQWYLATHKQDGKLA